MTARHYYRVIAGTLVEQTERILREGWTTRENAEEGSVGSSTIVVADWDMDQDYSGHRMWQVIEDDSESDDDVIFVGYTGAQEITRGEDPETFEPLGRAWAIELYDVNTVVSRRVLRDADRPAETDVERIQWLVGTTELSPWLGTGLADVTTYVDTGSPVSMDAADYTGQMTNAVFDDCAQQSGKNWFFRKIGNGVTQPMCVFYGDYTWDSPLSLSNDPADWVDSELEDGTSTVWPIAMETKLRRDPARVFSGAFGEYEGGRMYRRRASTEVAFALGHRDMIVPMGNVKTKAKANARLQRALDDASSQDERITTSVRVPKGKASMLRPGMNVKFKATHLPNYGAGFRWLRILNASPHPVAGGERYDIALELQGPGVAVAPDMLYSGTITIDGDAALEFDPTGASGWENSTVYGWSITATVASGPDEGYAWSWLIGIDSSSTSAAAYFDDANWLVGANGAVNTIDSGGQPSYATTWTRTGTFTTNDAGHFDASDHIYFACANANSIHGGSTWTWTWAVWKVI